MCKHIIQAFARSFIVKSYKNVSKTQKRYLHVTDKVLYYEHREQKHKKVWFPMETVEIQIRHSSLRRMSTLKNA